MTAFASDGLRRWGRGGVGWQPNCAEPPEAVEPFPHFVYNRPHVEPFSLFC